MSPHTDTQQEPENTAAEPEPAAAVTVDAAAQETPARRAARELRFRVLQEANDLLTHYELSITDWAIEQGRLTLDEAVELVTPRRAGWVYDRLVDGGFITAAEVNAYSRVWVLEQSEAFTQRKAAKAERRRELVRLLLPLLRDHLTMYVFENLIDRGTLTVEQALTLAQEANSRLTEPGVPATITLAIASGVISPSELGELTRSFKERGRRSREMHARGARAVAKFRETLPPKWRETIAARDKTAEQVREETRQTLAPAVKDSADMSVLLHLVEQHTVTQENVVEIPRDAEAAGLSVVEYALAEHLVEQDELDMLRLGPAPVLSPRG